jgi:hypothetical protein
MTTERAPVNKRGQARDNKGQARWSELFYSSFVSADLSLV